MYYNTSVALIALILALNWKHIMECPMLSLNVFL